MKVLMTADTIGGVWTYCMELCTALGSEGIEIFLATMGRKLSLEQHQQISKLPHVKLYESEYSLCWMERSRYDRQASADWFLSLEQKIKPDIVHLNDLALGSLNWQAPTLLFGHSCVLSWWEAVKKQPAPKLQWNDYRQIVTQSVQRSTLLAAPTQTTLTQLLQHYGAAKASVVIPHGRSFPPLVNSMNEKNSTAEPIIFTAGPVRDSAKNVAALSIIAPDLEWPIYVASEQVDPDNSAWIPQNLNALGVLTSDALAYWLKRASIYVAPSYFEPFGLSIIEAARAGCALVLGNIKSSYEVWGDSAIYADPGDTQQLQHAISELINDPAKRLKMATRAWQRAQLYSSAQMAADYLRCYRLLMTGSPTYINNSVQSLVGRPI